MTMSTSPATSESRGRPTRREEDQARTWAIGSVVALPVVWVIAFFLIVSQTQSDTRVLPTPWSYVSVPLAFAVFLAPAIIATGTGLAMWLREDRHRPVMVWWLAPALIGAGAMLLVSLVAEGAWWVVLGLAVVVTAGLTVAVYRAPRTAFRATLILLVLLTLAFLGSMVAMQSLWVIKA